MDWLFNFDISNLSNKGRIALAITGSLPLFGWLMIKFKPDTLEIGVDVLSLFSVKFKFRKKFRKEMEELAPNAEQQFRIKPLKPDSQPVSVPTPTPREGALQAWESLGKVLNKALQAYGQQSGRTFKASDALNLLCAAEIISVTQAGLLLRFYDLGKEIQQNADFSPNPKNAYQYQQVMEKLADWLNNEINRHQKTPEKPIRKTMVESFIPPVSKEHPHLLLTGVKGTSTGRRQLLDQNHYTIGADTGNDLILAEDDYVSGNHASLHYESGVFILTDRGSRNGTYLNGKRLVGSSAPIKSGDEIQIGTSVFNVSDT